MERTKRSSERQSKQKMLHEQREAGDRAEEPLRPFWESFVFNTKERDLVGGKTMAFQVQ